MIFPRIKPLPRSGGVNPGPVTPASWNAMVDCVEELEKRIQRMIPRPSSDIAVKFSQNGFTSHLKRRSGGDDSSGPCSFGELVGIPQEEGPDLQGIRGGMIYCGDKNFLVADYDLSSVTEGTWNFYIEVVCEANMDDDQELILPGIKTSSQTEVAPTDWKKTAGSYPSNDNPTVGSSGVGTIRIPIGVIIRPAVGGCSYQPFACGDILIDQCAGTLRHYRNNQAPVEA